MPTDYDHLPRPAPGQQQEWAERFEREWLNDPYSNQLEHVQFEWASSTVDTVYVSGCGPSLVDAAELPVDDGIMVTANNAWDWWNLATRVSLNVFLDPIRFIEQALDVPESIPVAAMFIPAKPAEVIERWFEVAVSLGDRFIPLRGTGQNGRAARIDREKLEPWKGIPVLSGCVICPAIQLASMMATRNIVLLGVDMDWSGPQPYWDGVDRWMPNGNGALYETTGKHALETWRDRLKEQLGITLWKGTPGGRVDCLEEWT